MATTASTRLRTVMLLSLPQNIGLHDRDDRHDHDLDGEADTGGDDHRMGNEQEHDHGVGNEPVTAQEFGVVLAPGIDSRQHIEKHRHGDEYDRYDPQRHKAARKAVGRPFETPMGG